MDRLFVLGTDDKGKILIRDVNKLNEFLERDENYDFEITEIKPLVSGEIIITVSDIE